MTKKHRKTKRKLHPALKFVSGCVKKETNSGKSFKVAAKKCGALWRARK